MKKNIEDEIGDLNSRILYPNAKERKSERRDE